MNNILHSAVACVVLCLIGPALLAQSVTSSGSLRVGATVDPSISLTIASDNLGITLFSGAGTGTAAMKFGTINAYATLPDYVSRSVGASGFTVSTPVDVLVAKANTSSGSYTLTAALNSVDSTNTWALNTTAITASPAIVKATGEYGRASMYTVQVTIPSSNTNGWNAGSAKKGVASEWIAWVDRWKATTTLQEHSRLRYYVILLKAGRWARLVIPIAQIPKTGPARSRPNGWHRLPHANRRLDTADGWRG
jgi:hypothetical protein